MEDPSRRESTRENLSWAGKEGQAVWEVYNNGKSSGVQAFPWPEPVLRWRYRGPVNGEETGSGNVSRIQGAGPSSPVSGIILRQASSQGKLWYKWTHSTFFLRIIFGERDELGNYAEAKFSARTAVPHCTSLCPMAAASPAPAAGVPRCIQSYPDSLPLPHSPHNSHSQELDSLGIQGAASSLAIMYFPTHKCF